VLGMRHRGRQVYDGIRARRNQAAEIVDCREVDHPRAGGEARWPVHDALDRPAVLFEGGGDRAPDDAAGAGDEDATGLCGSLGHAATSLHSLAWLGTSSTSARLRRMVAER